MKTCAKCLTDKPLEDFNKSAKGAQGRQRYCRLCQKDYYQASRDTRLAQTRESKARNAGAKYGLSQDELKEFRSRNAGMCESCHKRPGVAVDHDHNTNLLRGHLCSQCNSGIGLLGDTLEGVLLAVEYLKKHYI